MAVVGAIALFTFAGALDARTAHINLSSEIRIAIQSGADQLGQASSVLAEVPPENADAAETAIKLALIDTFRVVMIICAGLAWLSALMAMLLVESRAAIKSSTPKTLG